MNISKKSGHYRCISRLSEVVGTPSSSLCGYFWQAFFAINIHIIIPVGVVLAPLVYGGVLGEFPLKDLPLLLGVYTLLSMLVGTVVWAVAAGIAVILVVAGLGMAVGKIILYICKAATTRPEGIDPQGSWETPPNIVVEYLKAKKAKVCPIITYTEE